MASIIFIEKDRIRSAKGTKVIKSAEYATICKADKILEAARNRAEEILKEANTAYQAEVSRGYEEGLDCANKEMAKKITESAIEMDKFHKAFENQAIPLVMDIVKKVLKEIEPTDLIVGQVKKALEFMRNQHAVTLKVHPSNIQTLNDRLSELKSHYSDIKTMEVRSDQHMSKEDLILESPTGILEAGMDIQLKAIEDAFSTLLIS